MQKFDKAPDLQVPQTDSSLLIAGISCPDPLSTASSPSHPKLIQNTIVKLGAEAELERSRTFQARLDPLKMNWRHYLVGTLVVLCYGWRTRVDGELPKDRPVVVCPKHQWYKDTPIMGLAIMVELGRWANFVMAPFNKTFDKIAPGLGALFVHRMAEVNKNASVNSEGQRTRSHSMEISRGINSHTADQAHENVYKGIPIVIFPEAGLHPNRVNSIRVSPNSSLGKLCTGQADDNLIAFVPASIKRHLFGMFMTVSFGKPIYTKDCKQLQERLSNDIATLWKK